MSHCSWIWRYSLCLLTGLWGGAAQAEGITIFAAASLQQPLEAIINDSGIAAQVSYASSSTLARQIEFGAPADVFLSANADWADRLIDLGLAQNRVMFATNQIVLAGSPDAMPVPLTAEGILQSRANGRIAVPLLDAVPLGQYTKAALQSLNLLEAVQPYLAQTDNAGTARTLLIEGAVSAAFLYQSDLHETDLSMLAAIPASSHPEIQYVAVSVTPDGQAFVSQLGQTHGQSVFAAYGFENVD